MAEQKREKRTCAIIRRIITWIGLGLFTILLILTLIFQAPWKVISLPAIFLAACTIFPKRFRRCFWLGVGAVVIALIVWIFLPEDREGWRPYTFDGELAALEAKYAIPDEENAALLYDEIFKILDIDSNSPDFFASQEPSSLSGPWLSKDRPETVEWLKGHQNTVEGLIKAAENNKCHFKIGVDPLAFSMYIKRFPKMRLCEFLLLSVANNDVAENRIDAGIEKYLCALQMAHHQYQQLAAIDHIVSYGMERLALNSLNKFVIESKPSTEQLQHISSFQKSLTNNWTLVFTMMLEYERLFAKNTFCALAYEINSKGRIRLSRDPTFVLKAMFPDTATPSYWQKKFYKAETLIGWFSMPSSPRRVAERIDANVNKFSSMVESDYDCMDKSSDILSLFTKRDANRLRFNCKYSVQLTADVLEEVYYHMQGRYLNTLTLRRGSRLLLAIKQYHNEHGVWPPNLDAIKSSAPTEAFIDPVTGNPLEYENHGNRFSLYGETANIWPK